MVRASPRQAPSRKASGRIALRCAATSAAGLWRCGSAALAAHGRTKAMARTRLNERRGMAVPASGSGVDHGLQRAQVFLQRLAARGGERVPGDRAALDEI